MAFEFISSATEGISAIEATCLKPTGTTDDDIMFALVKRSDVDGIEPTGIPDGWAQIGKLASSGDLIGCRWLYWKLAASEGADYTWTWAASVRTQVTIATYRDGFNAADPIDVVSATLYTATDVTLRAASMDVSVANSPLIFVSSVHSTSAQSTTPPIVPTTFVEDVDIYDIDGRGAHLFASVVWSGSGATGNMDATSTLSTNDKVSFAVALNAGGGPAPPVLMGQAVF